MSGNQLITEQSVVDPDRPTRDRLLDAGMTLIAERGFNGVTVGEIEAAVGLAPRRGALYKHFPSKQALVEAAMEERISSVADLSDQVAWFASAEALADPRASLRLIAMVALDELDRQKRINQIIEKDGDRFADLRDRMRNAMVEPGFRYADEVLSAWVRATHGPDAGAGADTGTNTHTGPDTDTGTNTHAGPGTGPAAGLDVSAVATVLLSALVHHRRQAWLLGEPPHGIGTDRFIEAWVEVAMRALEIQEITE